MHISYLLNILLINIQVTQADKDARTKIHRWLAHYDNLHSETIEENGEKWIEIFYPSNGKELTRIP
jgi:hypothetical protein